MDRIPENKMKNTTSHQEFLMEYLSDTKKAVQYLNSVAEDGNIQLMMKALKNVIMAQGGISKLAKKTHLSRPTLHRTLSETGNPEIKTLDKILSTYGMHISFSVNPQIKSSKSMTHQAA